MNARHVHVVVLMSLTLVSSVWRPLGAGAQISDLDPRVSKLVEAVSEERLRQLVETLASFDTRHTLSNPDPAARSVGAAREWILDQMKRSSARLQVSFDSYRVPPQGDRITRQVDLTSLVTTTPGQATCWLPKRARPAPTTTAAARR